MKLNNRGWSLNTMVVLTVVLFLFVILVAFLMYNFGKSEEKKYSIVDNVIVEYRD